ncbi:MAG: efflux RND transporter permease subunit [Campylobacterota bacterium]
MFDKILRFFVNNSRINYTLFVLVFAVGVWSYNNTPKEIFPSFELDMISVKGSYPGTSVDILDKMAVTEIEDNLKNLDSVKEMTTVVSPGSFSIIVELKKGKNKYNESNKIKDTIALVKGDLPSDMDEPSVNVLDKSRDVVDIALTSNKYTTDELKSFADNLKGKILNISGVNDITIYGDSDEYYEILLDDNKIDALNLNKNSIFSTISTLSYIFPIGKIEDSKKHYFLSTYNGAKTAKEFANTLVKIDGKNIYLSDIATIKKTYEESSTLFSFNGKNALSLSVEQSNTADAIELVKNIRELIPNLEKENPNINITVSDDNSEKIQDRLNIVISNILLGIILITILVMLLINFRMSFIIAVGIPTSFVIAAAYMYFTGYTINLISLVGVLIAIGIVVDDAIVVSENIQQHIEEGYPPKEAAIMGAKEMVKPVTVASLTTLFSFLPILMISGTMGEVIKLIPIALSALVVASLIESFLFLPIHAAHVLKNNSKVTSWEKANRVYNAIIQFCMKWKKSFITIFLILVPIIIFTQFKSSKFQLFPQFDASSVRVTLKANVNTTLEESFKIVQSIEDDLMKHEERFFIRSIDSVAGFRRDVGGNTENFPYAMYMTVELKKLKPQNFLDKYITPYLSFYYDNQGRQRTTKSTQIAKELDKFLEQKDYKSKFNLKEIELVQRRVGPVKSDIKIGLVSNDNQKIIKNVALLEDKIESLEGILSTSNSLKFGVDELKLKVNNYGEQLGLTESFIGSYLSNLYLLKKKAVSFDKEKMLDIKIKSINQDDYENFLDTQIPLQDGKYVRLSEVVTIKTQKAFEQVIKDKGEKNFYVFANVDPEVITANEVMNKIDTTLKQIEKDGVRLIIKGEAQKKKDLMSDMVLATGLALILIMISMLYLFNSFKETFIVMSIIPFSLLGILIGHSIMDINLSMPSMIGALGLAGVVINDGIIMMTYLKKAKSVDEIFIKATKRFRPIIITTVTTIVGMSSLIFFPTGQAVIFQPIGISLGFGLLWGTILNLIYLPVFYALTHKLRKHSS